MNGVHDLGGLQDMGPVRHEKEEPVFHAAWEGRIYGIDRALRFMGKWNLDAWRHQIELLPPADYFRMTYYERWLQVNEQLAVKHGLVTPKELETGVPDPDSAKATPALTAAVAAQRLGRGIPSSHDPKVPPQFKVGQRVRARNMNPTGHTRLPAMPEGSSASSRSITVSTCFPIPTRTSRARSASTFTPFALPRANFGV